MNNSELVNGTDLPIVKLVSRNERQVSKKYYQRIEASIRAVGLLEPLIVFDQGNDYEILDGRLRYRILLDMGVETVPCLLWKERDIFTGNRMVNRLSASEEMRMLRKSLEELDEKTIASALALTRIGHRLNGRLLQQLEPSVVKAFENGTLNRSCALELTHVKPERQVEILSLMESCNDYSVTFGKGLVLKTPAAKRAIKPNGTKTPWTQAEQKKSDLLKRLQQAEQQQDFFSGLYRQYTTNLLKLVIYVRALVANQRVRGYLQDRYGQQLELFNQIITSTEQ